MSNHNINNKTDIRTTLSSLPPLREIIGEASLSAKKGLGQNFLLDLNITEKIARAAGDLTNTHIIEIGPGPGGLTRALLASDAKHVTSIELDKRCIESLTPMTELFKGYFTLIEGDALKIDPLEISTSPRAIIANLPYNIATPLMLNWLKNIKNYKSITILIQKEVAERIVAKPNNKNYGRLSIITQWLSNAGICFDIPPSAFVPAPKVTSSLIRLTPILENKYELARQPNFKTIEKITAAAFGQRRKMLRKSLKTLCHNPIPLLEKAKIDPKSRAEQIDVKSFLNLAIAYEDQEL